MSWECPECGEINRDDNSIRCVCGYVQGEEDTSKAYADMQKTRDAHATKIARIKKNRRPTDYRRVWKYICSWFDWETWKHAYSRWVFCVYIILYLYRGHTVDGLVLVFLFAYLIAMRFSKCRRSGESFVPGLAAGESIRSYGIRLALANSLYDWAFAYDVVEKTKKETPRKRTQTSILVGGMLLTIILLHGYMSIVIIIDYVAPEQAMQLLSCVNAPFELVLEHWKGAKHAIDALISHGYENRVPIVAHSFVAAGIGSFVYFCSCLFYLLRNIPLLEEIFSSYMEYYQNLPRGSGGMFLDKHHWVRSLFVMFVGGGMGVFGIYNMTYRLHFPGEMAPGSAHLGWLNSYVYTDNIGLFTPIFIVLFCLLLSVTIVVFFDPFYRRYLYIKNNFRRKK